MIRGSIEPIAHDPPLKRIDAAPYTPAPIDEMPDHIRVQIEHMQEIIRQREAARIWDLVVQSSRGSAPCQSE